MSEGPYNTRAKSASFQRNEVAFDPEQVGGTSPASSWNESDSLPSSSSSIDSALWDVEEQQLRPKRQRTDGLPVPEATSIPKTSGTPLPSTSAVTLISPDPSPVKNAPHGNVYEEWQDLSECSQEVPSNIPSPDGHYSPMDVVSSPIPGDNNDDEERTPSRKNLSTRPMLNKTSESVVAADALQGLSRGSPYTEIAKQHGKILFPNAADHAAPSRAPVPTLSNQPAPPSQVKPPQQRKKKPLSLRSLQGNPFPVPAPPSTSSSSTVATSSQSPMGNFESAFALGASFMVGPGTTEEDNAIDQMATAQGISSNDLKSLLHEGMGVNNVAKDCKPDSNGMYNYFVRLNPRRDHTGVTRVLDLFIQILMTILLDDIIPGEDYVTQPLIKGEGTIAYCSAMLVLVSLRVHEILSTTILPGLHCILVPQSLNIIPDVKIDIPQKLANEINRDGACAHRALAMIEGAAEKAGLGILMWFIAVMKPIKISAFPKVLALCSGSVFTLTHLLSHLPYYGRDCGVHLLHPFNNENRPLRDYFMHLIPYWRFQRPLVRTYNINSRTDITKLIKFRASINTTFSGKVIVHFHCTSNVDENFPPRPIRTQEAPFLVTINFLDASACHAFDSVAGPQLSVFFDSSEIVPKLPRS